MFKLKAKLIYNKKIEGNYYKAILETKDIAKKSCPGQFINVKVSDDFIPLLRRPFSIHNIKGKTIEILYEALGQGTQILAKKKPGANLDIIGPLGTGFTLRTKNYELRTILVAGGMGVAPLIFLAEKLAEIRKSPPEAGPPTAEKFENRITVLIGVKTKKQIICEKEFRKLGCDVKIATDDGSRGFKGYVSELLESQLRTKNYELRTIYACGPKPMLKEISKIAQKYKIPAQVSLESHLACGIGACLGCVVDTKEGFKRVCKEGPVFNAQELKW